jgi:hypothetical protein
VIRVLDVELQASDGIGVQCSTLSGGVMNHLFVKGATLSLLMVSSAIADPIPARPTEAPLSVVAFKANQMAEYAYQAGCLDAFITTCGKIAPDEERSLCQREGIKSCGGNARTFRLWIENGRKL